ncbi:GNAT family N-acetyltransferase [Neptunicella sp. SCSIO 80796]|uniref:GNAT family N-acetyltransferase n=1 Tax=Neptunicella plasticusilytica TaxID=3117012 RepID=UPI003A4DD8A3
MSEFRWCKFSAIDQYLLQTIYRLRQKVFIVEQQSLYQDIDGLDEASWHLLLHIDKKLVGYLRIRSGSEEIKIERVVLEKEYRGADWGVKMMRRALQKCSHIDPVRKKKITLTAQTGAMHFYQKLDFEGVGEPFDDAGIEHIKMEYKGN